MQLLFLDTTAAAAFDPCQPSPCGSNALCNNGVCSCSEGYHGDAYFGCRPECVYNTDCPSNKMCQHNKCINPCSGTCGVNAICDVMNHIPMCTCPKGMSGNAFVECRFTPGNINLFKSILSIINVTWFYSDFTYSFVSSVFAALIENPCNPSPCGPNSQCRQSNGQSVCSCVPGYRGSPPTCRPECTFSTECSMTEACNNQRCINPCVGACGVAAICEVINHNPICTCPQSFTGDPFIRCTVVGKLNVKCFNRTSYFCYYSNYG